MARGNALGHCRCATRAHADDSNPRLTRLQPPRDAGDEGSVSYLHHDRVELSDGIELEADRPGALGNRGLEAVDDEDPPGLRLGIRAGILLGRLAHLPAR